jgi:type VI protein secretion system component VasK
MKSVVFLLVLFFCGLVNAQDTFEKPTPLATLFDSIYSISNSYDRYKIIKKIYLQDLKQQSLDSVKNYKQQLAQKDSLLKIEIGNFKTLKAEAEKTQIALKESILKENNITLFGTSIRKTNYNLVLWLIMLLLLLGLCIFIYKYNNNKHFTKKAQNDLTEIEEEFAVFRKKTLEREQKLRRQLQDEINKQRNS